MLGYNGLGDHLSVGVNGAPTTYTLDLKAGLTQILADGTNTYLYGPSTGSGQAGRIAQQSGTTTSYFLGDALGSVRQMADASSVVRLVRNYGLYGSTVSSAGSASSVYGFTGEMADTPGLIFLRARYYAPYRASKMIGQRPLQTKVGRLSMRYKVLGKNRPKSIFLTVRGFQTTYQLLQPRSLHLVTKGQMTKRIVTGGLITSMLCLLIWGCRGPSQSSLPPATPTLLPVAELAAILNDPDSQGDSLAYAADQVRLWGAAAQAVPGLQRALRYKNSYDARLAAAIALAAIGPQAESAIPDLIQALDDLKPINAAAALALGNIGVEARCAVPYLAARLWSGDAGLRTSAAVGLDAITGKELVEPSLRYSPREAQLGVLRADDDPEGSLSGRARAWWESEGQFQNWGDTLCHPPPPPQPR